jgi:hypothetical protein
MITISGYNPDGGFAMDPPDQPWFTPAPVAPAGGTPEDRAAHRYMQQRQGDLAHRHEYEMWARRHGHLQGVTRGCPCGCD